MDNEKDVWDTSETQPLTPSTLFAVCIGIGIISIVAASYFENLLFNIGVPLGVMFYYIYAIRQAETEVLSLEQQADSVYYMGFIFTLVAMTASLVVLANNDSLKFNTIVANFGLALSTTILGLTVRIIWLQMNSQDLEDADALLRDKLIKMSQKLYDNNERIVSAMTAIASQMEKVSDPIQRNYEKLAKSFDISDQINQKLSDLNITLEMAAENVQELASSVEKLNPEFEDLNLNAKEAVEIPAYILNELNQLKREAESIVERSKEIAMSAEQIDVDAREATNSVINGLRKSLNAFEKTIEQSHSLMDSNSSYIGTHIEQSKAALEDINAILVEGANSIREGNIAVSEALKDSAKLIEESRKVPEADQENDESKDL